MRVLRCPKCFRRVARDEDDRDEDALSRHRLVGECRVGDVGTAAVKAIGERTGLRRAKKEAQQFDIPEEVRALRQAYHRAKKAGRPITEEMLAANREYSRLRYEQLPKERKPRPKRSLEKRAEDRRAYEERKRAKDAAYQAALARLAEACPAEFAAILEDERRRRGMVA